MAFVTDKEELKPGLIIFRRADVQHRNWYCRVKVPKEDRYKTFSLKTDDITTARRKAWRHDGNVEYALEHDVPLFNRSFAKVAEEFLAEQLKRVEHKEITALRVKKLRTVIEGPLADHMGSTQVHLIGDDTWKGYAAWRRTTGEGRSARNGVRPVSAELAARLADQELAAREKARQARGLRARALPGVANRRGQEATPEAIKAREAEIAKRIKGTFQISDSTIRFEMSVFSSVMGFAMKKKYAPVSQRYESRPKLKIMRRDEFSHEEYKNLYTYSRDIWVKGKEKEREKTNEKGETVTPALSSVSGWYRTMTHNFVLIMCNTGMRPSEAKNLCWEHIKRSKDRDGHDIVTLFVQGTAALREKIIQEGGNVSKFDDGLRADLRQIMKSKGVPDDKIDALLAEHRDNPINAVKAYVAEHKIALAEHNPERVAVAAGSTGGGLLGGIRLGALAGGTWAAIAGSETGPGALIAAGVGGLVGAVAGGFLGEEGAKKAMHGLGHEAAEASTVASARAAFTHLPPDMLRALAAANAVKFDSAVRCAPQDQEPWHIGPQSPASTPYCRPNSRER
jgi:integrase